MPPRSRRRTTPRRSRTASSFSTPTRRNAIAAAHADGPVFTKRLPAIVAGARRIFDVADIASEGGSAGIAVDVTEVEAAAGGAPPRDRLQRAHARPAADRGRDLRTRPAAALLQRRLSRALRPRRRLPRFGARRERRARPPARRAQAARAGRLPQLARRPLSPPTARSRRASTGGTCPTARRSASSPTRNPQGGVTWVYENVTERLDLESRYNALVSVQGETLDHLAEGVAVFGSDGRLRLHNPSFAAIWSLDPALLAAPPACRRDRRRLPPAGRRRGDVARASPPASPASTRPARRSSGRMERADGRVIDYATVPLPDGQTMVTFVDVTDSVQVERALVERNEALEAADTPQERLHPPRLLRAALAAHQHHRLRPAPRRRPRRPAQRQAARIHRLHHVVERGAARHRQRHPRPRHHRRRHHGARPRRGRRRRRRSPRRSRASQDRLDEARHPPRDRHRRRTSAASSPTSKRVRQILYNLLVQRHRLLAARAAGSRSRRAPRRRHRSSSRVADEGAGIPSDFVDSVFDRFASHAARRARAAASASACRSSRASSACTAARSRSRRRRARARPSGPPAGPPGA